MEKFLIQVSYLLNGVRKLSKVQFTEFTKIKLINRPYVNVDYWSTDNRFINDRRYQEVYVWFDIIHPK